MESIKKKVTALQALNWRAIACGALPELTDPGAGRKPDKKRGRHT